MSTSEYFVLKSVEPNHKIPESVNKATCLALNDTDISNMEVYGLEKSGSNYKFKRICST